MVLPSGFIHWTAQPFRPVAEEAATIFPSGRTRTPPGLVELPPASAGVSTMPLWFDPNVVSRPTVSGPVTAVAVTVTGWVPSRTVSSTGVTVKVVDACPAGMVTD